MLLVHTYMTSPGIPQSTFLQSRTRWYVKLRTIRITVWRGNTHGQTDRYSIPAGRQYIVTESHNLRDLEKREGSYTQKGHNSVFITITKSPKSPKAPFQISIISDMTTHHLYELTSCDVISTSYQFWTLLHGGRKHWVSQCVNSVLTESAIRAIKRFIECLLRSAQYLRKQDILYNVKNQLFMHLMNRMKKLSKLGMCCPVALRPAQWWWSVCLEFMHGRSY